MNIKNTIKLGICAIIMLSVWGCGTVTLGTSIYNVDDSAAEYQYVCENEKHFYYYTGGNLYKDDGKILCKVNDGTVEYNVKTTMAADNSNCYYCDLNQGVLMGIDVQSGEKVELETGISYICLYGFPEGVFALYDKGNSRYLKYYSQGTVISVYDEILSKKEELVKLQTTYNVPFYSYQFDQYNILLQFHAGQPILKGICDNKGKAYSENVMLNYIDNQDIYEFLSIADYKCNGEECKYDANVSALNYEKDIKPQMASIQGENIFIMHEFVEDVFNNRADQQILTVFNLENKEYKVLYQTEENESIVNYSVQDNRLYTLKDGKVYEKTLDASSKKCKQVCKVSEDYSPLGFAYVKGRLFIYDYLQGELIGIYE